VSRAATDAIGEALVKLLDKHTGGGAKGGANNPNSPPEDAGSSKYFAAMLRCVHACAGAGAHEKRCWDDATVASVVAHARRFFHYGLGAGGAAGQSDGSGAFQSVQSVMTPQPPASPSKGGYVPPHLRGGVAAGAGAGSSDSDAQSDADAAAGCGLGGGASDRFGASRVRGAAALCVGALARANPRSLHAHWPKLLPASSAQLLPRSPTTTLLRVALQDPAPRVRAAALSAIAHLLEGNVTRQYMAVAEVRTNPKTGAVIRRNFASLSSTLGDVAATTHDALVRIVQAEPSLACLPAACKALSAFVDAAPFGRLPPTLLPRAIGVIWTRVGELSVCGGNGGGWASRAEGSSSETTTARTSLLAALTAALSAKDAPDAVTAALSGRAPEPFPADVAGPRGASGDLAKLVDVLPGLASFAAAGGGVNPATRCEAFGALRAAATAHAPAVAALYLSGGMRDVLPGTTCGVTKRETTNDAADALETFRCVLPYTGSHTTASAW
jgi:hypothetical protein